MANKLALDTVSALHNFNSDYGTAWTLGENWSNVGTKFETFINKYLFPKINETALIDIKLGNRFNWLAKEVDFIGQYSEEFVIMDTVPIAMNLSNDEELMLKRNYPKMATKLYGAGILKKVKFTLNNNDVRLNFSTLADGVSYALAVFNKKISDINLSEEREIKGLLVDYALNQTKNKRIVQSEQELFNETFNAILNIQNNSELYNEANTASGGTIGRYTTVTKLEDVAILTTDKMKTFLLDTKLANTFQVAGLDISKRIISFDTLGGIFKAKEDIKISSQTTVDYLRSFGDYQVRIDSLVPKESVFTFDVSQLEEFKGKVEEVKPKNDLFSYIFDINKLKYRRNTKGMLKEPFINPEFDEVTHWLHYYSFKAQSPFYNNVLVTG